MNLSQRQVWKGSAPKPFLLTLHTRHTPHPLSRETEVLEREALRFEGHSAASTGSSGHVAFTGDCGDTGGRCHDRASCCTVDERHGLAIHGLR